MTQPEWIAEFMWFKEVITGAFGVALFFNAVLFIPQTYRIIQKKGSKDISLTAFIGFCIIQLVTLIYGRINHDYILFYGYIFALITCGSVVVVTLIYRK